jgi:hypothetical protein
MIGVEGYECPKKPFIEKLLEEEVHVEEGEPILAMLKEAGITRFEDIRFVPEEEPQGGNADV